MANKFSKSILERLEQEQQKPQNKKTEFVVEADIVPKSPTETIATAPPIKKKSSPQSAVRRNIPDLSDYLQADHRRQAKNKTFYLDTDLIAAIKQAADSQGMAESRLVNDILRKVLGV